MTETEQRVPTAEQRAAWRKDAVSWGPLGGDIRSDRILALLDALDRVDEMAASLVPEARYFGHEIRCMLDDAQSAR